MFSTFFKLQPLKLLESFSLKTLFSIMSNLKKIHGSMNSLFSVSSSTSLRKKTNEKSAKYKDDDLHVHSIYNLLDRGTSPSVYSQIDSPDLEGKLHMVSFKLLLALKNKKELCARQEISTALRTHGSRFLSDLLGYIAEFDAHKMSKRGIVLMEACGKLARYLADYFIHPSEFELPCLVTLPKTETLVDLVSSRGFLLSSDPENQHCQPAKRPRVDSTLKTLRTANTWRRKKEQVKTLLRRNRKALKTISTFAVDELSTSSIIDTLLHHSFTYYLVQPISTPPSPWSFKDNLNGITARLLWHSTSKLRRDFYIDNELQTTVEEHGVEHLNIILWHVLRLNEEEINREGFNIDYVRGSIVGYIVKQLRNENRSAASSDIESSPEPPSCYFRVPFLKRTCEADSTQRNAPIIPVFDL